MKVLYLVRHAQASFGSENYDRLSSIGHEQSRLLGQALSEKGLAFDYVACGSMTRHLETHSGAFIGDQALVDQGWDEFDHRAIWEATFKPSLESVNTSEKTGAAKSEGEILLEFREAIRIWMAGERPASEYPESWPEFQLRIDQALTRSIQNTQKCGVVFTSGGAISAVAGRIWGLSSAQILSLNWSLINSGITKILIRNDTVSLASFNEHHHLERARQKRLRTYM